MSEEKKKEFKRRVYAAFKSHGRHFPWRNKGTTPYHILVSEIMLQQTQVFRVLPKYRAFLREFPSVRALALAPFPAVLRAWHGLGYNRRAKNLHDTARMIVTSFAGRVPRDPETLEKAPGIGPYTARAIAAFAYNTPTVFIETNIRSVFLHHFFPGRENVRDENILPLIEETLDQKNPRAWYTALMDYGAFLKGTYPNPERQSAHYLRQSQFAGSHRQIRGKILSLLLQKPHSEKKLCTELQADAARIKRAAEELCKERLVSRHGQMYRIRQ